jgi:GH25 family lysozyme M1 (1,4-beta-N-acetylmuramidase)
MDPSRTSGARPAILQNSRRSAGSRLGTILAVGVVAMLKHIALASLFLVPSLAGCASNGTTDSENPDSESEGLKVCAKGATVRGVDVSKYQGSIDWKQVAAHGIKFAIARVGDGQSYVDPDFGANWAGMKAHGIIRGTYQFFRAGDDPIKSADNFVKTIKAHGGMVAGDLPPVLDVEVQDGVSDATLRAHALKWLEHVEAALGKRPMIYSAPGFWNTIGAGSEFTKYTLWVANWQTSCPSMPSSWSSWKFWQDADNGHVPGISGNVDTDYFNGSLADLKAFAGATSGGGTSGGTTSAPASLGGNVADQPGVGRNPDGRLEVFGVGPKGNLVTAFQKTAGGAWSDWFSLGGNLDGRPAVNNNLDGRLELFVRSAAGAMEHAWQDAPNGKIGAFASLGGKWTSDPTVARNKDGRLEVFAIGTDGALHHASQTKANGGWSAWATLGTAGGGLLDPQAILAHDGKLRVVARGKDGATWITAQQASGWSTWSSVGGKATSAPAVVMAGGGQLALFVRGTDGALWHAWEKSPGGAWSTWISLGGQVQDPYATTDADGRMDVFVRGSNDALYRTRQKAPGGSWEGFTKMGGSVSGRPAAAQDKDGRLEVFYRSTDGSVHHAWEKAPEQW